MMWPEVEAAWPRVARHHEGVYSWPYLDTVSKVTVGVGLLIEADNHPTDECFGLPWTVDEVPATRAQIAAGWNAVNSRTDLAGRASQFATVSRLRLDDRTIDGALIAKTHQFWSELHSQLVNLDQWPADAQLGLLDMAYQLGPNFLGPKWPNFTDAAHASDFDKCSQQCSVKQASPERNAHRIRLFTNAALVAALNLDPSHLWDTEHPKEDNDMAMTDAERLALIRDIAAEVRKSIPTASQIATQTAREVLDSKTSDLIKDGTDTIRVKSALERLLALARARR